MLKFTITGNGTIGPYRLRGRIAKIPWTAVVEGADFDGGTVAVQIGASKDGRFHTPDGGSFTADGSLVSDAGLGTYVQVVTTGRGATDANKPVLVTIE